MRIFFLGAGNSASIILEELRGIIEKAYFYDKNLNQIKKLQERFDAVYIEYKEIEELRQLNVDYVVEVASIEALCEYGIEILKSDKNLIVLSTGAFADENFRISFMNELKSSNSKVYIATGAIGGLDLIEAIYDKVYNITLITKKRPESLGLNVKDETVVFDGSSTEAIKVFPRNVNVAVTLSLAVRDFNKVQVKIVADPLIERNKHIIKIESKVGNYKLEFENYPSENPKTSYLAPLSIVRIIKRQNIKFKIGG
ncbi:aspartate dehydrogenase [Thermosipho ferrireducens]|uniref:L-aspartate dehydrogenase n=1 Tax=Thermosipho ferrireducens TaxID=2571116 RepID=A0ABX7S8U1_9BACT|nr:aspartate dehydrogenase [Thermosipho ferrireducens]QTA38240.1 aspartate dehydrogenase [Thermosipho ferrireducens]